MNKICDCYRTKTVQEIIGYNSLTGKPIFGGIQKSICFGTRELDECNCNGDEANCTFYLDKKNNHCGKKNTHYDLWKNCAGYCTPGGDPVYVCPSCGDENSKHVHGIENHTEWKYCPNCGKRLYYPGEV